MTQLELNTAIFNKLNDCATSVFNSSGLSGSYTANELTKIGLGSNEVFKISIGSFYCEIEDYSIFKVLCDFAKMNGFRLKKFMRNFEDFKVLGHLTFPKSAKCLYKFGDADDNRFQLNSIQLNFGINQAFAWSKKSFIETPFFFNGSFSKRVIAPLNFIQIVGTDFDVVKAKKGVIFFQNGTKRCKVEIIDEKGSDYFHFMARLKYNEQLIFKFDVNRLKSFFKTIKNIPSNYDNVTIEINKWECNALLSYNGVRLTTKLLEIPKYDFNFKISLENFERLCMTNGVLLFKKFPADLNFCSRTKEGGIIVIRTEERDNTCSQKIITEDKQFLLYGIEM